jgi:ribonuclease HI
LSIVYTMPYYAVAVGKTTGIFENWNECKLSVSGFRGAIYKKFDTRDEADTFIKVNQISKSAIIPTSMIEPGEIDYYVYTDGACSNNGKSSASAGIGIFFGTDDHRNVSRKIDGKQTNNTAELRAIIDTYHIIYPDIVSGKKIAIVSDSEYAIKCATSYGEKCSKTGWKKEIPNQELVKTIYDLYVETSVQFIHVRAHTDKTDIHSIGNDYADKLANLAIGLETCPYH